MYNLYKHSQRQYVSLWGHGQEWREAAEFIGYETALHWVATFLSSEKKEGKTG